LNFSGSNLKKLHVHNFYHLDTACRYDNYKAWDYPFIVTLVEQGGW